MNHTWRITFENGQEFYITSEPSISVAIIKAQTQAFEVSGILHKVMKAERI